MDEIDGIAPPIAIRQKNTTRNPRSTVATSTELYDFLRLLWARVGRTFCPNCGIARAARHSRSGRGRLLEQPEGSRWYALFPSGEHGKDDAEACAIICSMLRKQGIQPAVSRTGRCSSSRRRNRCWISISRKPLFVLVDRLRSRPIMHQRLVDTVEICYREVGRSDLRAGRRDGRDACASTRSSSARPAARNSRARAEPVQLQQSVSAHARAARDSATPSTTTWTW